MCEPPRGFAPRTALCERMSMATGHAAEVRLHAACMDVVSPSYLGAVTSYWVRRRGPTRWVAARPPLPR
jgi:hypothetical protein